MHYLPPALTGNNKSFPHHEPCRGHDGGPRPRNLDRVPRPRNLSRVPPDLTFLRKVSNKSMAALCREFGKLTLRAYCREFGWLTLTLN